jgi:hypothetical protein
MNYWYDTFVKWIESGCPDTVAVADDDEMDAADFLGGSVEEVEREGVGSSGTMPAYLCGEIEFVTRA